MNCIIGAHTGDDVLGITVNVSCSVHGSNIIYAKLPQKPSFPNGSPTCLLCPGPPVLPPPGCHNRSVCAPPSTTCHQPKCLYASLYNMSSTNQCVSVPPYTTCRLPKCMDTSIYNMSLTKMSACLTLQHLINQSVCLPPSTTCQQPTFCVRPAKMCHQLKYLHASILQRDVNQSVFIPPSTNVINKSVCMSLSTTRRQPTFLHASLYTMLSAKMSAYLRVSQLINQSIHMSTYNITLTKMSTCLSMICHQPKCF